MPMHRMEEPPRTASWRRERLRGIAAQPVSGHVTQTDWWVGVLAGAPGAIVDTVGRMHYGCALWFLECVLRLLGGRQSRGGVLGDASRPAGMEAVGDSGSSKDGG